MKAYYSMPKKVAISNCDASAKLGVADTFEIFQDIAGDHAELLGIGNVQMAAKGLFWITMRTRVHFYKRPYLNTELTAETWPAKPGAMRTDRYYRLTSGDTLCAEGRTEWCVLNVKEGKTVPILGLFGEDVEFSDDTVLNAPYARLRHDFGEEDIVLRYTVLPSDIDLGNHMNNIAYTRLLMNTFSVAEQKKLKLSEAEILFMSPCLEGETLLVHRRAFEGGWEFGVCHADGKYAVLARYLAD